MDALASEGLRLTNFNVEVQCTPSRSALMTGRYAVRSGNGTVPLGEGVHCTSTLKLVSLTPSLASEGLRLTNNTPINSLPTCSQLLHDLAYTVYSYGFFVARRSDAP